MCCLPERAGGESGINGRPPDRFHATSAVDLKFLHSIRKLAWEFQIQNRTRIITLLVSLLIAKLASEGAATVCDLRNRDTSEQARQYGRCRHGCPALPCPVILV